LNEGEEGVRLLFVTAAAVGLMGASANASPFHAGGLVVQNAAAVLNVITEDRTDIDVVITPGSRLPAPHVSVQNGAVVVDGDLQGRIRGCGGGWFQIEVGHGPAPVRVAGVGVVPVAELPHIVVRAPRTLQLKVAGAVYSSVSASAGGEADFTGCGDVTLGPASGDLKLTLNGDGDVNGGAVGGALDIELNGSGDARVADVHGATRALLNGSGDLSVGNVGGGLEAQLHGSGDARIGDVGGAARLQLTGSGDVRVGHVHNDLSARLIGSGDVDVSAAAGPNLDLELASSGDLDVHEGHAERLTIRDNGSGDVSFGGHAETADLELQGSGEIAVAGAVQVSQHNTGSGNISVGH
jgi:hypothetical protein